MIPLLASAAGAAVLYLLVYCYRAPSGAKSVVKTVSVAALALAALVSGGPVGLVIALGLCALGDYLLSRPSEQAFLAGVGAFAAGHLAYVVLFLGYPQTATLPMVPALMMVIFGLVMMGVLYRHAGDLRFAVLAYVPIIVAMGLTALLVVPDGSLQLVLPAALLFMASDTILAFEMFVLRADHPLRRLTPFAIWSLYWLAQLGFWVAFT